MSNKNEPDIFEQMSIFQIMNLLDDQENTFSSEDISKIIDMPLFLRKSLPEVFRCFGC